MYQIPNDMIKSNKTMRNGRPFSVSQRRYIPRMAVFCFPVYYSVQLLLSSATLMKHLMDNRGDGRCIYVFCRQYFGRRRDLESPVEASALAIIELSAFDALKRPRKSCHKFISNQGKGRGCSCWCHHPGVVVGYGTPWLRYFFIYMLTPGWFSGLLAQFCM